MSNIILLNLDKKFRNDKIYSVQKFQPTNFSIRPNPKKLNVLCLNRTIDCLSLAEINNRYSIFYNIQK